MKNMKVLVVSCLLAVSVLFSACDKKESNVSVASRVNENDKPVTTVTEEVKEIERLREYVYETNEVPNLTIEDDYVYSNGFVFVHATLEEYECHGYNENKYIDKEERDYISEMTLRGVNGTEIKGYLGSLYNGKEYTKLYNKTGYIIGDETNIKDYVGKEIVVYGRIVEGKLTHCDVALASDVDSFYEKKMNDIKERENTVYTSEMLVSQYKEDKIKFYRMFYGHDIKFESECIEDGVLTIATQKNDGITINIFQFKHDETDYDEGDIISGKGQVFVYFYQEEEENYNVEIHMYDPTEQE